MSPEDMQRFQVDAMAYPTECADVVLTCDLCGHTTEINGQQTLAELVQRAEEHTEVCR